jgi:hypothetical protein
MILLRTKQKIKPADDHLRHRQPRAPLWRLWTMRPPQPQPGPWIEDRSAGVRASVGGLKVNRFACTALDVSP